MKDSASTALLLLLLAANSAGSSIAARYKKPVSKACRRAGCNKSHSHNNSWCSAECCKEDRRG